MNKFYALGALMLVVLLSACGAANDAATAVSPTAIQLTTALPTQQPTPNTEPATALPATAVADVDEELCAAVQPTSTRGKAAHDAVRTVFGEEPTFKQITSTGDWLIAQASFEQVEAGVFLLHNVDGRDEIAAVWGGVVEYDGQIQQYFAQQAPTAPQALLDCFEPQEPFAQ